MNRLPLLFCVLWCFVSTLMAQESVSESASEPVSPASESASESAFRAEPTALSGGRMLIAPHANSVVLQARLWLIVRGDEVPLALNGNELRWNDRFAGDVHVAILRLDIGKSRLQIGDDEIQFVLGRNEESHAGPKDWLVYRLHNMKPGPNPCLHCHECEKEEGKVFVGNVKTPQDACYKCHLADKIDEQHANTKLEDDWREKCSDCHFIHASPHMYLLRQPRELYLK
ncbi:MAG: hypothetical protein Q4D38_11770 [Planctomycetia bacterium]|nr:hypothetical protein [Planctomycetia bacterium]